MTILGTILFFVGVAAIKFAWEQERPGNLMIAIIVLFYATWAIGIAWLAFAEEVPPFWIAVPCCVAYSVALVRSIIVLLRDEVSLDPSDDVL